MKITSVLSIDGIHYPCASCPSSIAKALIKKEFDYDLDDDQVMQLINHVRSKSTVAAVQANRDLLPVKVRWSG